MKRVKKNERKETSKASISMGVSWAIWNRIEVELFGYADRENCATHSLKEKERDAE
jgi:hypothetical protein